MPIQFRCGACNQLLGIAARKAGAVVNCPTCGGRTIVPRPREGALTAKPGGDFSLLEKVDVDKLLGNPIPGKAITPKPGKVKKSVPKSKQSAPVGSAVGSDPHELRALTASRLPEALSVEEQAETDSEGDDLPQVLEDESPTVWLSLGPVGLAVAAGVGLALLAAAFAAGWWFGQPG